MTTRYSKLILLLPVEASLLEDTIQRANWHVQPHFPCYRNGAWLNRMMKMTVTAFRANEGPSILLK